MHGNYPKIKEKHKKLNNKCLPKIAKDSQTKIGWKYKDKYWYGYKKHASIDMQIAIVPSPNFHVFDFMLYFKTISS